MLKKLFILTAALVAAVAVFIVFTLPTRRVELTRADDGTVAGLLHVHTNRSDGSSSPDQVAAAAARAGLQFLVFTDHGDATRAPDPPTYRFGVLCLDGVEISTSGGHYVAIDMPASPYPLAGEARDVVEDVHRLGGFGIAAHPDSPKAELRWNGWSSGFDGIELLNPDTSWRVLAAQPGLAPKLRLLAAFFDYPFRAPEVMASLIQPTTALERWEAAAEHRRVVTLAGADAHAKLAPRDADPDDSTFVLPLPGYEASFRVMSVHVRPDRAFVHNAAVDAGVLVRAIRNGHLYTAIDAIASPPAFEFTATNSLGTVRGGDVLGVGGPVQLRVQSNAPPAFTTVVHQGTKILSSVGGSQDLTVHGPADAGVYWAEIVSNVGKPPITWVRSNPVYVREPLVSNVVAQPPITATQPIFDGAGIGGWRLEHDRHSDGAMEIAPGTAGQELRYRFALAGGAAVGQFTALVHDLPSGAAPFDRVAFAIRADRAMRVSIQVRDTTADRWQRSIYIDSSEQERTVRFDDLKPVGATHVPSPSIDALRAIMLVVDTTNTKPGTTGRIWIRSAALQR